MFSELYWKVISLPFHNIVLDNSEEIPIAAQGAYHLAMKDLQMR